CAIGFNTDVARRIASSSQSLRRSWRQATSPPASASSRSLANLSGSSAGGVIRYSRVVARVSSSNNSVFALIGLDDAVQHVERFRLRPLERVAADDRAVAAAIVDRAHLVEHAVEVLRLAAREDDDPATVEGRLHDMLDPRRRGRDVDLLRLVDLLRRVEFEMRRGRL